jgi:RNA polymerase sigma-32 factor
MNEKDRDPVATMLPVVVPQSVQGKTKLPAVRRSRGKEVALTDALSAYLREIRRYPRLSREEEFELARRYFEEKDLEAAYQLISSNLWLVVKIAREYERATRNVMDLVQEGNMGLMEAVKNFDPFRNVRFPSYAIWWIKAYIVRYVIANWRLVKIGTTQAQRKLFFNLNKERERLEREGFSPTAKMIADNLEVREKDVIEMEQRLSGGDVSIDAPLSPDGEWSLLSVLPNSSLSVEDLLADFERVQLIKQTIEEYKKGLKERERIILERRLLSEEKDTLQDLSELLGLSRERVRQVENKIKEKLRTFVEQKFADNLDDVIEVN